MELFILATTALAWAVVIRYALKNYLEWKQENK